MSFRLRIPQSLRFTVLLPMLVVGVCAAFVAIVVSGRLMYGLLHDELRQRATALAYSVNYVAESVSRPGEMQRVVSAMGAEQDVTLIAVVGGEPARILACTRQAWVGQRLADVADFHQPEDVAIAVSTHVVQVHTWSALNQMVVTAPMRLFYGDHHMEALRNGVVVVHVDTRSTARATWSTVLVSTLGFLVMFSLVGAMGYVLFSRIVLTPLGEIGGHIYNRQTGAVMPAAILAGTNEISVVAIALEQALTYNEFEISVRKNAEESLRVSEYVLSATVNTAMDAVVQMDSEGVIIRWNNQAEKIFGWPQAEAIGQKLHHMIILPQHHEAVIRDMHHFLEPGEESFLNKRVEILARHRDRREFPIELSITPLKIAGMNEFSAFIRDITDQVAQDRELQSANEQLAEKTVVATALASQAQQASVAKSAFLATMSHEIRTPMNGIIGMTGLLLDTEMTPEQRRMCQTVRTCSESLLTLINDILDFSKVEAGKLELESIRFDVQALLDDLTDVMVGKADEKRLELICAVAPEVPMRVQGDPGRLRQILTNLVGNALKFTKAGEIVIQVTRERQSAAAVPAETVDLRFSVIDTGIGIPADKRERLFQAFSQVDASTTREFGGTGLGLAICKQLSELMGGTIGVDSHVDSGAGQGSTFWFTVRLLLVADGQPNPPPPPTALVGARVLLVDTQLACRRINSERLTTWGMQVQTADSLRTCLDQVQRASQEQRPFRFVIIALSRTDYDGPALIERLRADATLNDMTVIALVGSAEREVFKRRLGTHCAGYLPLPVRVRDLQELMVYQLTASHEDRARSAPVSERWQQPQEVRFANTVRVLMAEDNPVNQLVGRGILRKLGIEQVDIVGNGFEALHALSEKRYDLVLMDMQMPEMDGLEATRAIRDPTSMVIDHAIPILALTANARSEDQAECTQAGMNGFVSKPINVTQLATVLSAWLKAI